MRYFKGNFWCETPHIVLMHFPCELKNNNHNYSQKTERITPTKNYWATEPNLFKLKRLGKWEKRSPLLIWVTCEEILIIWPKAVEKWLSWTIEPYRFANILPAIVCIPALSARQRDTKQRKRWVKKTSPAKKKETWKEKKLKTRGKFKLRHKFPMDAAAFNAIFLSFYHVCYIFLFDRRSLCVPLCKSIKSSFRLKVCQTPPTKN